MLIKPSFRMMILEKRTRDRRAKTPPVSSSRLTGGYLILGTTDYFTPYGYARNSLASFPSFSASFMQRIPSPSSCRRPYRRA